MVPGNMLPPEGELYQMMPLPVTERSLIFCELALQKLWLAAPVGGAVVYTVSVGWSVKSAVEQPLADLATTL